MPFVSVCYFSYTSDTILLNVNDLSMSHKEYILVHFHAQFVVWTMDGFFFSIFEPIHFTKVRLLFCAKKSVAIWQCEKNKFNNIFYWFFKECCKTFEMNTFLPLIYLQPLNEALREEFCYSLKNFSMWINNLILLSVNDSQLWDLDNILITKWQINWMTSLQRWQLITQAHCHRAYVLIVPQILHHRTGSFNLIRMTDLFIRLFGNGIEHMRI